MGDTAEFNRLLAESYQIMNQNDRGLQEIMQSIQEVGPGVLRPNPEFTTGALKGAKMARLGPKATELENLVRHHGNESIQQILGHVKQTTQREAQELLQLWHLWKNEDAASAKSWAEDLMGAKTGEANELVEIWGDMKHNRNNSATQIAVLMHRLDDPTNKNYLALVNALAKK